MNREPGVFRRATEWLTRPNLDGELSIGRWIIISVMVGIAAGLGAAALLWGIDFVNRETLLRIAGFGTPALPSEGGRVEQVYLPYYRWWIYLLVPTLGGLVNALLVYTFAPEAAGDGTDAMLRAYHREGGMIRVRVPLVKIIASAVTLGSGGSGGREGPITQVGAGFGSWFATTLGLPDRLRRIVVIAGAAGGLGAIFRAPLGGALIGCEFLYRNSEFEYEAIIPALLTSVVAYTVFSLIYGWAPMFATSRWEFNHPENLLVYLALGVTVAAAGWFWVKVYYGLQDGVFARLPIPRYFVPAVGGLLTGLVGLAAPQAIGLGYGWVQAGMFNKLSVTDYVAGAVGKMFATGFTLGSGGSGGVFGPAVVIGGFIGGAVGKAFALVLPTWHLNPEAFILVGMAAFFGGAAKAPIGALLMISEMTSGYGLLVPLMLSCAIAVALVPKSISIYREQVDGSLNSPAHFDEYLQHVLTSMRERSAGADAAVGVEEAVTSTPHDLGLLEVDVAKGSAMAGARMRDLSLGEGVLPIAIRRRGKLVSGADLVLREGDRAIIAAGPDRAERILSLFGAHAPADGPGAKA